MKMDNIILLLPVLIILAFIPIVKYFRCSATKYESKLINSKLIIPLGIVSAVGNILIVVSLIKEQKDYKLLLLGIVLIIASLGLIWIYANYTIKNSKLLEKIPVPELFPKKDRKKLFWDSYFYGLGLILIIILSFAILTIPLFIMLNNMIPEKDDSSFKMMFKENKNQEEMIENKFNSM